MLKALLPAAGAGIWTPPKPLPAAAGAPKVGAGAPKVGLGLPKVAGALPPAGAPNVGLAAGAGVPKAGCAGG